MSEEIVSLWNNLPRYINPVAIRIGPLEIRWYGIMYAFSFLVTYWLVVYKANRQKLNLSRILIDDYFFWMMVSVILGARIGYVLFYNLDYFMKNPLEIFLPFEFRKGVRFVGISGLSYHGGLIGVILGSLIFCYKKKVDFWMMADLVSSAVPLGYTLGRIGNFLNGELYGRPTDFFLGMYFPVDPLNKLRHPSQLYEAFFEGILLFLILNLINKKIKIKGIIFSLYILGYGFLRFMVEFLRQPDSHLGLIWLNLTMGQILCVFMMGAGVLLLVFNYLRKEYYV